MEESEFSIAGKVFQISSDFVMRQIGGEYAIIPVGEECMFSNAVMAPNDSAVFIWKAFQTPSTAEAVVRQALEVYEGSADEIRKDVNRFVREALDCRILREVK